MKRTKSEWNMTESLMPTLAQMIPRSFGRSGSPNLEIRTLKSLRDSPFPRENLIHTAFFDEPWRRNWLMMSRATQVNRNDSNIEK
jgi:hypothetical protein